MRNYVLAVIVGLAGLTVGAAVIVLNHRVPAPAPGASAPPAAADQAAASLPAPEPAPTAAPDSAQPVAPQPAPEVAAAPPAPPAAPALPNVDVAPLTVHAVPDEEPPAPTVTLVDRDGRTIREIKPSAPLSPTYQPSVGTAATSQRFASNVPPPPARSASAPVLVPPIGNSRLAATSMTAFFNGAATAVGATVLSVGGHSVKLFGVRVADPRDQCGLGPGDNRNCADVARDALAQRLQRNPRVSCHVPPGQRGDPAAVCADGGGTDLAGFLIAEGYALADTNQSYDYFGAEGVARSFRRGLWRYR
jgi:endonuclease YncB( thermonuclease family)